MFDSIKRRLRGGVEGSQSFGITAKKNHRLDRQFLRSSPRLITVEARLDGRRERERERESGERFSQEVSAGRRDTLSNAKDVFHDRRHGWKAERSGVYIALSLSLSFSLCLSVEAADSRGVTLI